MTEYSYDPRGNMTQILENGVIKKSYTYDATNRMVEAVTADGDRAEYVYNGFLKRVKKLEEMKNLQNGVQFGATSMQDPVREMRYILDLTRPYNDLLAIEGQENQHFIWGSELLMVESEKSFYYLSDHLGSPIRLMGNGQEEVLAFDEFGVPTVEASVNTDLHNPFGFTGYQTDELSGTYYAQARYYDPANSRMLSEDPFQHGINWYAYCCSNPLRLVDLDGHEPAPPWAVRINDGEATEADYRMALGFDKVLNNSHFNGIFSKLGYTSPDTINVIIASTVIAKKNVTSTQLYDYMAENIDNISGKGFKYDDFRFDDVIDTFIEVYNNNKETYQKIAEAVDLPPELIDAIHYRESTNNFNYSIQNGSISVNDFTQDAIELLLQDWWITGRNAYNLSKNSRDIVAMCAFAERYNGLDYFNSARFSPYVFSGTNLYSMGKFISDKVYDPTAIDKQVGVYQLLMALSEGDCP